MYEKNLERVSLFFLPCIINVEIMVLTKLELVHLATCVTQTSRILLCLRHLGIIEWQTCSWVQSDLKARSQVG